MYRPASSYRVPAVRWKYVEKLVFYILNKTIPHVSISLLIYTRTGPVLVHAHYSPYEGLVYLALYLYI